MMLSSSSSRSETKSSTSPMLSSWKTLASVGSAWSTVTQSSRAASCSARSGSDSNSRTEKLRPRRNRHTHSARVVPPLITTRCRVNDFPTKSWWAESKTSALATRKIASFSSMRVAPSGMSTSRPRLIAAIREPFGMGSSESRLPTALAPGAVLNCCISTCPRANVSTASAAGFRMFCAIARAVLYSGQFSTASAAGFRSAWAIAPAVRNSGQISRSIPRESR